MAGDSDEPNGGRATVALVSKQIEALDRLMQSEFKDVQRQLDNVTGLPLVVNGLIEQVKHLKEDLEDHKRDTEKRRDYRIGPLPLILIGLASVIVAIVALVVATHGG